MLQNQEVFSVSFVNQYISRRHDARRVKWLSLFSIRQAIEGLLVRDSPESLFYVLLYSLLSTVQI